MFVFLDASLADQTSYQHCLARRKTLTQWLMQAAASTVEKEVAAAGDSVRCSPIRVQGICYPIFFEFLLPEFFTPSILQDLPHLLQDSEYLGALLSLVSGRQIGGACRLANQHRDHKLALLLGQITGGNPNFRRLAYEQLDMWRRLGVRGRGAAAFIHL